MSKRLVPLFCLLGLPAGAGERPAGPSRHWAFEAVARPAVPAALDAPWARNPIDLFIAAEQLKRGVRPEPMASKTTLLRRVTVDLTGLPPTREELRAPPPFDGRVPCR